MSNNDDSDSKQRKKITEAIEVTQTFPNFDEEEPCKCVNRKCETTNSCSCFKFGTACNESCGCAASCQNIFNDLDHFFGDKKYSANPCFSKWLKENNSVAGATLRQVDLNFLRELIMRSTRYDSISFYLNYISEPKIISYTNVWNDERISEWTRKWNKIKGSSNETKKMAHTQKYFTMLLSPGTTDYYYSFCLKDVLHDDYNWHCMACQKCERWNSWHCGTCNKCEYIQILHHKSN